MQKTTQTAYPLWDIDLARNTGRVRPYLRLLNLANTGYTEIPRSPCRAAPSWAAWNSTGPNNKNLTPQFIRLTLTLRQGGLLSVEQ